MGKHAKGALSVVLAWSILLSGPALFGQTAPIGTRLVGTWALMLGHGVEGGLVEEKNATKIDIPEFFTGDVLTGTVEALVNSSWIDPLTSVVNGGKLPPQRCCNARIGLCHRDVKKVGSFCCSLRGKRRCIVRSWW